MTKKNLILRGRIYLGMFLLVSLLSVGSIIKAYSGSANTVIENVSNLTIEGSNDETSLGGSTSDNWNVGGNLVVDGTATLTGGVTSKEANVTITADTTATAAQSGSTFFVTGATAGGIITLPAAAAGLNYRVQIGGAFATNNVIIDSAEGDNIEGTLLVAGAVVDCAAEDQINFIADGENIGDYVEIRSDGTNWLIGSSGALTSAKLTCTDPS